MSRFTKFFVFVFIVLGTGLASCTQDEFSEIQMESIDISAPSNSDGNGGGHCPGGC